MSMTVVALGPSRLMTFLQPKLVLSDGWHISQSVLESSYSGLNLLVWKD